MEAELISHSGLGGRSWGVLGWGWGGQRVQATGFILQDEVLSRSFVNVLIDLCPQTSPIRSSVT